MQEWTADDAWESEDGQFVLASDAEAAIAAARAEATCPDPSICDRDGCAAAAAYQQGQRDVFALHPEWTVTGMCTPDCLPCQRLTELITERSKGYDEGQRDMLARAVRAVEQFDHDPLCMGDDTYCCSRNVTLNVLRALLPNEEELRKNGGDDD
jgi:hypothetical protein